jgi:hypothetical protein
MRTPGAPGSSNFRNTHFIGCHGEHEDSKAISVNTKMSLFAFSTAPSADGAPLGHNYTTDGKSVCFIYIDSSSTSAVLVNSLAVFGSAGRHDTLKFAWLSSETGSASFVQPLNSTTSPTPQGVSRNCTLSVRDLVLAGNSDGSAIPFHTWIMHRTNMIAIVAVQPNVILGRQYVLSQQIEPDVFALWQNITYSGKNIPFLLSLNDVLKRYSQKEKTGRAVS